MLLAKRIGPAEVYLEAGGQFSKDESTFEYGVAGAYPLGHWRAVLELSGSADDNADPRYLVPGIFWQPAKSAHVGLGIPVGLTHDAADWGMIFKLIIELGGD